VTVDKRMTAILPDVRRLSGVAVAAVPAEYAGLNPGLVTGDVIYALNNQRIVSLDGLRDALKDNKSGDAIALQVEQSRQLIYVTAALE
jgi:serine protease Do